jgi:hypothetical protein
MECHRNSGIIFLTLLLLGASNVVAGENANFCMGTNLKNNEEVAMANVDRFKFDLEERVRYRLEDGFLYDVPLGYLGTRGLYAKEVDADGKRHVRSGPGNFTSKQLSFFMMFPDGSYPLIDMDSNMHIALRNYDKHCVPVEVTTSRFLEPSKTDDLDRVERRIASVRENIAKFWPGTKTTKGFEFGLEKYVAMGDFGVVIDYLTDSDAEYNVSMSEHTSSDERVLVQAYVYNRTTGFSAVFHWPSAETKNWRSITKKIEETMTSWQIKD